MNRRGFLGIAIASAAVAATVGIAGATPKRARGFLVEQGTGRMRKITPNPIFKGQIGTYNNMVFHNDYDDFGVIVIDSPRP